MAARPLWEPEDRGFWLREGRPVAHRNLAVSIPALALAFAVWMMWSVVVVELPQVGFRLTPNQLYWLAALPGLAGGVLRLFFGFMVPLLGGRRWTAISTAALLIPTLGLALAVQDPSTPYPVLVALAIASGIGGGNFASSMAHVALLFPAQRRGMALGLNAGFGNLGVVIAQLAIPAVIVLPLFGPIAGGAQVWSDSVGEAQVWLQNAGLVWAPLIVGAAIAAWYGLDDLASRRASMAAQASVVATRETWLLAWLYLGSFGSFIGFSAGLPLAAALAFPQSNALPLVFIGPLVAALARPAGGGLADRIGGARVAMASFALLAATMPLFALLAATGAPLASFALVAIVLFAAAGLANGAVARLVMAVFVAKRKRAAGVDAASAERSGSIEGAAALGFASGIAAFGGFFIPKALGTATAVTGGTGAALALFALFYLSCVAVARSLRALESQR